MSSLEEFFFEGAEKEFHESLRFTTKKAKERYLATVRSLDTEAQNIQLQVAAKTSTFITIPLNILSQGDNNYQRISNYLYLLTLLYSFSLSPSKLVDTTFIRWGFFYDAGNPSGYSISDLFQSSLNDLSTTPVGIQHQETVFSFRNIDLIDRILLLRDEYLNFGVNAVIPNQTAQQIGVSFPPGNAKQEGRVSLVPLISVYNALKSENDEFNSLIESGNLLFFLILPAVGTPYQVAFNYSFRLFYSCSPDTSASLSNILSYPEIFQSSGGEFKKQLALQENDSDDEEGEETKILFGESEQQKTMRKDYPGMRLQELDGLKKANNTNNQFKIFDFMRAYQILYSVYKTSPFSGMEHSICNGLCYARGSSIAELKYIDTLDVSIPFLLFPSNITTANTGVIPINKIYSGSSSSQRTNTLITNLQIDYVVSINRKTAFDFSTISQTKEPIILTISLVYDKAPTYTPTFENIIPTVLDIYSGVDNKGVLIPSPFKSVVNQERFIILQQHYHLLDVCDDTTLVYFSPLCQLTRDRIKLFENSPHQSPMVDMTLDTPRNKNNKFLNTKDTVGLLGEGMDTYFSPIVDQPGLITGGAIYLVVKSQLLLDNTVPVDYTVANVSTRVYYYD